MSAETVVMSATNAIAITDGNSGGLVRSLLQMVILVGECDHYYR
jgi:hypothetical protein